MNLNLLKSTKCYLVGHMQYANGRAWRDTAQKHLESIGVTVFNPYKNPFIEKIDEGEFSREQMLKDLENGDYDLVREKMKKIRAYDLSLVDRSDFIIAHIIPKVASWGSQEEIVVANRAKKPIYVSVEGGKKKCSLWHFAQIPHEYIYDSVPDILDVISEIDNGTKDSDSSRWKLLLKSKR